MQHKKRSFSLARGLKRALSLMGISILAFFGAEAARQAGAGNIPVDAGLLFCGALMVLLVQKIK